MVFGGLMHMRLILKMWVAYNAISDADQIVATVAALSVIVQVSVQFFLLIVFRLCRWLSSGLFFFFAAGWNIFVDKIEHQISANAAKIAHNFYIYSVDHQNMPSEIK